MVQCIINFQKLFQNVWGDLWKEKDFGSKLCCIIKLLWFVFCTFIILVFWQPVTAFCKFFNDGRHDTSEGEIKVERRTEKRYTDLAASRGKQLKKCNHIYFVKSISRKKLQR